MRSSDPVKNVQRRFLGTHIARIDDRRLKAAFAAAVNLQQQAVGCLQETTETAQASTTAVKALD
jgi:multidrug resistance efflux pump